MTPESRRSTWKRGAARASRLAAGTIGAAVVVALIVVGAVVAGLLAVGIALFGAVWPASATSPTAARVSPHVRTKAPRTAADEAGR